MIYTDNLFDREFLNHTNQKTTLEFNTLAGV